MGRVVFIAIVCLLTQTIAAGEATPKPPPPPDPLKAVLENTEPLKFPRGERLPLFVFTPELPKVDDVELEKILKELDARGISLLTRWAVDATKGAADFPIRVAKLQKKLGLRVAVDASGFVNTFSQPHNDEIAHKDADNKAFFDTSTMWQAGCPFEVAKRAEKVKAINEAFIKAYKDAGVDVDFWSGDFEFDGALEWNDGWAAAKKCKTCQAKIPKIADFSEFQKAIRAQRTEMQAVAFSRPIKAAFPKALVGVYGMNPNDGHRYWWDFFEKEAKLDGVSYIEDHGAVYRPWPNEFAGSDYTMAMPVLYGYRFPIPNVKFNPYDFKNREMGWLYGILKEASSVRKNADASTPIVPFVAWATPQTPTPEGGLSEANYEDALWHMLLRGNATFMMWCPADQTTAAIKPVHRVYSAALEYKDFLDKGTVAIFDVPDTGTIVSALKLGNQLLVRRTDFDGNSAPVTVKVDGKDVSVPAAPGKCQVIKVE